jgi:diketogulonate reductase-like aldo/keto reductase
VRHLEENMRAADLRLSRHDMAVITAAVDQAVEAGTLQTWRPQR